MGGECKTKWKYLKPERQTSVEGEEPLYRLYCSADDFVRASYAFLDMVSVVVGDVIVERRHQLEVESPYAETDIESCIC